MAECRKYNTCRIYDNFVKFAFCRVYGLYKMISICEDKNMPVFMLNLQTAWRSVFGKYRGILRKMVLDIIANAGKMLRAPCSVLRAPCSVLRARIQLINYSL